MRKEKGNTTTTGNEIAPLKTMDDHHYEKRNTTTL
jgi:hypothetical protein